MAGERPRAILTHSAGYVLKQVGTDDLLRAERNHVSAILEKEYL